MREYRQGQGVEQSWSISDQLLVAVSPSPYSARLVRAARRMAGALHARWYAAYVEPSSRAPLSKAAAERLAQNLSLAERLGAEVVTLNGDDAPDELLRFAREHHVTKLITGKPLEGRLARWLRPSLVDELVRQSGEIDVYVTAGDPDPDETPPTPRPPFRWPSPPSYAAAAVLPGLATAMSYWLIGRDQLPDVVMIYLLGIMLASSRFGFGASLFVAAVSVAAFDFVFVPPYFTLAVADLRHGTTFAVMFVVALVISGLTQRIRNQARAAREREQRTAGLYALSRDLAAAQGFEQVSRAAAAQLEKVFRCGVSVFSPGADGELKRSYASPTIGAPSERDVSISCWVWSHAREAGLGTSTLPSSDTLFLPLMASSGLVGVLGLTPEDRPWLIQVKQRRHLDAFATQMALALERVRLAEAEERARREVEAEQLRSSLLSSVSHDLRTPLAVITGGADALLRGGESMDDTLRQELLKTILEESERLNRLIRNLLDMTRLESAAVTVRKEWLPLEEVIGAALNHLDARFAQREVRVVLPDEPPLVPGDPVLLEQLFINLLENAAKYSSGVIEIEARFTPSEVQVEVNDRGPGVPAGEEERIFQKFHRLPSERGREGVGLGLAICRAIAVAHGGKISASNREGGGASLRFTLPLDGAPPLVAPSELAEARLEERPA